MMPNTDIVFSCLSSSHVPVTRCPLMSPTLVAMDASSQTIQPSRMMKSRGERQHLDDCGIVRFVVGGSFIMSSAFRMSFSFYVRAIGP